MCPLNNREAVTHTCVSRCRLYHDFGDGTGDCSFVEAVNILRAISHEIGIVGNALIDNLAKPETIEPDPSVQAPAMDMVTHGPGALFK